jgi:glycosyltransferase involved in cell wall biosynthesis
MDAARARFALPQDKRLIMFGAMHATRDRRKGFQHLERALPYLTEWLDPAETAFVILGADGPKGQQLGGFDVHYLGIIRGEDKVVEAYNTADAFVLPAEADNLPNVVKEATCCGVPCVGFDVGGMPDMVEHLATGYLARPYDPRDLAAGIAWVAQNTTEALRGEVRTRAATKHAQNVAVDRYLDFYREILSRQREKARSPAEPVALRDAVR